MTFEDIQIWLQTNSPVTTSLSYLGIILLALASYVFTKRYVVRILLHFTESTQNKYDDIILAKIKPGRLALAVPLGIFYFFASRFPEAQKYIEQTIIIFILWIGILLINSLIDATNEIYESRESYNGKPIKGYLDLAKIFFYIIGGILTISLITGKSPWILIGGLGALTAVLLLVFRDTILSLVASIQLTSNDLVKEGDWLEVPSYGADGDVIDMALHTVKIQNFDKTITVIPTYKLMEVSYKNWRGMQQSGGRRIKRAIYIDIDSIKICDQKLIERFKGFDLIKEDVISKEKELQAYNKKQNFNTEQLINGRSMTNIGIYQDYIKAYLCNHPDIHKDMPFLVRMLQPSPTGLPIEIYVFTNTTDWVAYEGIQAEVFNHLLAVAPQFGLHVFQQPTGKDFGKLVLED